MNSDFIVAVHALVYLGHRKGVLSSEELAGNICTNPARVRKVMAKLKKAELVETKEGSEGGCRFSGDPERVDLARVARALDVTFVEAAWHSGNQADRECLICSGMGELMDELFADLDRRCKERLGQLTIADLERRLFAERGKTAGGSGDAYGL